MEVFEKALHNLEKTDAGREFKVPAPRIHTGAFIPSSSWAGPRPGFVFKRGTSGIGYYEDPLEAAKHAARGGEGDAMSDDEDVPPEVLARLRARKAQQPLDAQRLLREAEEAAAAAGGTDGLEGPLDARALKRMVVMLEKRFQSNTELRMRYAGQPEKFLESEVELDEAVKRLSAAAASPELYGELVAAGAAGTVVALLGHENSDLVNDVLEVLSELTDTEAWEGEEEADGGKALAEALVEANGLEALVNRLHSLDEGRREEDAAGAASTLSILSNLVEISGKLSDTILERTTLLRYLLGKIRAKPVQGQPFDANRAAAADLLATLIQGPPGGTAALGAKLVGLEEGVDALLQAVASYRNRDPEEGNDDEEGFVDSVFDALCSCLLSPGNRLSFVDAEGVELMLMVLKTKRYAGFGALRCLDFATTKCRQACERLVDLGGLKSVFACFMGRGKVRRRSGDDSDGFGQQVAEKALSTVFNLLQALPNPSARRDRVCAKFVEAEFEKCDRLVELIFEARAKLGQAEERIQRMAEEIEEEVDEDELLLARLEAGLFHLQQGCIVAAHLWQVGDPTLRRRLVGLLHQQSESLGLLRGVLLEYHAAIGDTEGPEERDRERGRLRGLLKAIGTEDSDLAAVEQRWEGGAPPAAAPGAEEAAEAGQEAGPSGTGGAPAAAPGGEPDAAVADRVACAPAPPSEDAPAPPAPAGPVSDAGGKADDAGRRSRSRSPTRRAREIDREREKDGDRRRRSRSRSRDRDRRDKSDKERRRSRSRSRDRRDRGGERDRRDDRGRKDRDYDRDRRDRR